MTLRTFLPALFIVSILATTLFSFVTVRYTVLDEVELEQRSSIKSVMNSLQGNIERFLLLNDPEGVKKVISSYGSQPDLKLVFVTDKRGKVIVSNNLKYVDHHWKEIPFKFNEGLVYEVPRTKVTQLEGLEEQELLTGYASVCGPKSSNSLRAQRCGFMFYAIDTEYKKAKALESLVGLTMLSILGFIVSALLFSLIIYLRVTRRVTRLVTVLEQFSKGDRSVRTKMCGSDELTHIGNSIDQLFKQLIQERAELVTSEKTQSAIINSSNYAIISTNPNGLVQTFNKAAEQLLGYQAEDVINQKTPAIWHLPEEVVAESKVLSLELDHPIEPGFEVFVAKARLGLTNNHEWTYVRQDGSHVPVMLSVSAISDQQGNITHFVGVARDLTEQNKVDRIKSEFISTVSHELRTPLTSIKGSLGIVQSGMLGKLPEKVSDLLKIALNNSDRLITIINDILDIEKIAAGKMEFEMTKFSLNELLAESIEANKSYAEQYGVSYVMEHPSLDAIVNADQTRIMQVMANLLSNAAKFSHQDGQVEITLDDLGESYKVSVIDHGTGIPEEAQATIFDRFTQADSSDTRQKGGTGLGLSITKGIVEKHGGKLEFISSKQGTTFYFELLKASYKLERID